MPYPSDVLALIDDTQQVRIETRSGDRSFRTIIWVVVDDGTVYVRSVRGGRGRWYQRALADPKVALHIGHTRIDAQAAPAADDQSVERTSEALRRKYPKGGSLDAMLRDEVLATTLRLDPRP